MWRLAYLVWLRGTQVSLVALTGLIGVGVYLFGARPLLLGYMLACILTAVATQALHVRASTRAWALLMVGVGAGIGYAEPIFKGAMHDIALLLGHHGRFGCTVVNADGESIYWLRDEVFGWLLFWPVAAFGVVRWIQGQRAATG